MRGIEIDLPFVIDTPSDQNASGCRGIPFGQRLSDGQVRGLFVDEEHKLLPRGK